MSVVRGWCPSAHRPMMSGDGLLVRIKPRLGRLLATDIGVICDLADRFGSGLIDLTARGNLQLRGVQEADHPALLDALLRAGLVDDDPAREAIRNVTATPFWQAGDLTDRMHDRLVTVLTKFDLPPKMGLTLDTGPAPVLQGVSGDFRFETADDQSLILRAEGAERGLVVSEQDAPAALSEMIRWFLDSGGAQTGRMARHLKLAKLPPEWQQQPPGIFAGRPGLGGLIGGRMFGVPFGSTDAATLRTLLAETGADAMRVTPWRMLFLEGANPAELPGVLSKWHPVMNVSACPGAPFCPQATVRTREIAQELSQMFSGTLHVSGCAKGCARPAASALTLVGREGRFDLVQNGRAGDTPVQTGLTAADARMLEV